MEVVVGHAGHKVEDGVNPPLVRTMAIGLHKVFAKGIFAQEGGAITGIIATQELQDREEGQALQGIQ